MTRPIRITTAAVLALTAAAAAALPFLLPPRASRVEPAAWMDSVTTVRGAYHVHSTISDGTGSLDDIGAAAAAAGLQFVIVTDHGDGTRIPEPARYRGGALVIEGAEINTTAGHLVALGQRPSPYPLAGEAGAVIEDVHRLGGIGIAAHPGSPRPSLQWTEWDVPLDGIEWLNADSEWRDELVESLGRMLLTYPFRPAETLASMLDRADAVMAQWDRQTAVRRTTGLAAADAHARLGPGRQDDPYSDGWHVALPGYESSFRSFSTYVILESPLSGDAARDSAAIVDAVLRGRTYSVIDAIASPGGLDFRASNGTTRALSGDELDIGQGVEIEIRVAAPAGSRTVLLKNGTPRFDTTDAEARVATGLEAGAYRVEVYVPEGPASLPWLVSNPIYIGMREPHRQAAERPLRPAAGTREPLLIGEWSSETSPESTSSLAPIDRGGTPAYEWRFSLRDGTPAGQYAAIRLPVQGSLAGRDRLHLVARADRPMRAWVQLRASTVGQGDRWGQSVYIGPDIGTTDVFFDAFVPLGSAASASPPLDRIDSILFVVDTLNSRPGSSGVIHIVEAWLDSAAR